VVGRGWADNAEGDASIGLEPTAADPAIQDAVLAELGIVDPNCDPTVATCTAPATAPPPLP